MQLSSLRRQLTLLFVLLLTAQVVVLALLYSRMRQVSELHNELLQLDEIRTELYGLRAATLDAETGQRGFVITGREEFLQPYRAAVLTFQPRLKRLRSLVAGNPALKQRVDALSSQLLLARTDLTRLVELRRHDGFEAAQKQMLDGAQREAMELLRDISLELDEEGQRQTQAQAHRYLRARSMLIGFMFCGFCGGLLITAGLGVFVLTKLRTLTVALGRPLVDVSRSLRAVARTAARDATNLAEFAKSDADTKAEGQATLEVITRMAKDLSTVAMEITSSVRAVAERPEVAEPYAAQVDRIITLAGRVAQSALSLELTTSEQRRAVESSSDSIIQLEQSVKSGEQAAARLKKLSKDLVSLLQVFPGLMGKGPPTTAPNNGSSVEISPVRT